MYSPALSAETKSIATLFVLLMLTVEFSSARDFVACGSLMQVAVCVCLRVNVLQISPRKINRISWRIFVEMLLNHCFSENSLRINEL